ncbi:Sensor histidine kinase RcsC [Methylobacterium crusticola]|uniref:histidine kinase n=1 Tax=Methylobacterium crusticola TaxID=1697972 RepID=A0ABQ4QSJ1_9HYPH|nr:ATP-binding protein [Methylobacterium crusticola]GJD48026.1 Sensor histidine kinase RcsC [Methylobacterium crusticola]
MRLRTLLAAAFASLALALTLAGSLAVQQIAAATLRDRIAWEVTDLAGHIRAVLDASMYERWADMQILSRTLGSAPGTADQRSWISALHAAHPAYAWAGFADRSGQVTASTGRLLEGSNVAARPWFRQGLAGPHAGDVHEALLLETVLPPLPDGERRLFVDVSAPVQDPSGAVVGVVGGHLSWSWAEQVAARALAAAADRGLSAVLLDRDGTVLLGPADLRGRPLPDALASAAGAAPRQGLETWPDGVTYLVGASASVGVGGYKGLGWTVLVRQPAEAAFAPARALSLRITAGGAAFAALFALAGWWTAGIIVEPLLSLAQAAGEAGRGGSGEVRLPPPRGSAEVRTLTASLAGLLARLAERDRALAGANRMLEAEVAARTRELAESRAFLENVLCTSPDCITVLDLEGHVVYVNDRGAALLEQECRDAVAGRALADLFPEEGRPPLEEALRRGRAGEPGEALLRCPTRAGVPRWWSVAVTPMRDAEGVVIRLLVLSRDVTRIEEHTDALRLARDLAELAQARAESASRAKTDFVAMMSHEIRTPLNAIKGFTDLLAAEPDLGPVQRRYAANAATASAALRTIVDDVLDFTKIEAGQCALDLRPFDLGRVVEDAVAMVSHDARSKNLPIEVDIDPDLVPWRRGDEARLRQVLVNLLGNAVKFTEAGCVRVTLRPEGQGTHGLRVAVTDSGIGIPADRLGRLFRVFSQADSSTGRHYGGTGLGLAISKRLVELMDGRIGVESREGSGSTFWFKVRLPPEAPAATAPPPLHRNALSRAARLLLVDDLAINLELAKVVLERAGFVVDVALTAAAAVAAVPEGRYDLLLIDVVMPDMDGMALTRAIRGLNHPARHVPIIAMSANVLPEQVAVYRAAGMNDHVGKPFAWEELYATIERWLPEVVAAEARTA